MRKIKSAFVFAVLGLSLISFPVQAQVVTTARSAGQWVLDILNVLIPILVGLGLFFVLWGILKFLHAGDDAAKRAEGRSFMVHAIIFLTLMITVWGFVNLLDDSLGLDDAIPDLPNVLTMP